MKTEVYIFSDVSPTHTHAVWGILPVQFDTLSNGPTLHDIHGHKRGQIWGSRCKHLHPYTASSIRLPLSLWKQHLLRITKHRKGFGCGNTIPSNHGKGYSKDYSNFLHRHSQLRIRMRCNLHIPMIFCFYDIGRRSSAGRVQTQRQFDVHLFSHLDTSSF